MTTQDENENPVRILCTEITNDFTPKITTVSYKGKVENGVMMDKFIESHNNDNAAHSGIITTLTNKNNAQDVEIAKKANLSNLASVATSGSYNDLSDKPTIPDAQVNADWNAQSGAAQILNKPTIPDAQVNSDWNAQSGVAQILNKPTIPAAQVNSDWNSNSGVSQILNKPTIPTVNNATLTITQGGVSKGTFSANASSDTTVALDAGDLTESYINGTSWYRIYSDGWCEQGGVIAVGSSSSITFLKPYTDTNYSFAMGMVSTTSSTGDTSHASIIRGSMTTNGFTIHQYSTNTRTSWVTFGYIS